MIDEKKTHLRNSQITRVGVVYDGHYNRAFIRLEARDFGISIPFERIAEFCEVFPETDWENGAFLENLNGTYIRVIYTLDFKVLGIMHIIDDKTYWIDKEKTYETKQI